MTYYPEIVLDDGVRREASSVGLPSSAIFADVLGPATGSVIRFLAFAPAGAYRRVAVPTSPFDAAFPSLSAEVRVVPKGSREGIIPYFGDTADSVEKLKTGFFQGMPKPSLKRDR